jgi:glutamine amidotransferase
MITIVDYQMGNLRSVQKALEKVGAQTKISSDAAEIAAAEKLVLPGVGAFGDAMAEINRRDLAGSIRDFIASGKPFLGICLGLQLLFDRGFENGEHEGLGVIPGDVVRFNPENMGELKVPHMGWNTVKKQRPAPMLTDTTDGTYFYFVHSFYVRPADPSVVALTCQYGHPFCAAIWKENVFATQFHPEKSQGDGLKMLASLVDLNSETARSIS